MCVEDRVEEVVNWKNIAGKRKKHNIQIKSKTKDKNLCDIYLFAIEPKTSSRCGKIFNFVKLYVHIYIDRKKTNQTKMKKKNEK